MKIGRNNPCPCGSGEKYKTCCLGIKDWERLILTNETPLHLTLRGKNLYFLHAIASILGFNPQTDRPEWSTLKSRLSVEKVGLIHDLVRVVWPSSSDLYRALKEDNADLSGIYTGDYTPQLIVPNIMRHALYSDTIYLFDPLIYPGTVRPEFDPINHPEKYVTQTIKCLFIWFSLAPLVEAGILKFIRSPADFDNSLRWNSLLKEAARLQQYPELKELLEKFSKQAVDKSEGDVAWMKEFMMLAYPDEEVESMLLESGEFPKEQVDHFLKYRAQRKKDHPYYTERRVSEFVNTTIGETHGMSRLVAEESGSFLLTDNEFRWKIVELERAEAQVDDSAWEPFASAVQNTTFKYLDGIALEECLKLRKDGLLVGMRSFLRRVWSQSRVSDDFSKANAEQFAMELEAKVAETEVEWKKIDANLLKWFTSETAAAVAAVPTIGVANVGWMAASLGIMGVANLTEAQIRRHGFSRKMPGAFFLGRK